MPLTNEQHASIMRQYDEIQLRHARELDARRREAYAALPRLAELDAEAASLAMEKARILIDSLESGLEFLEDMAVFLVAALPWLIAVAVVIAGICLIVKAGKKQKKEK